MCLGQGGAAAIGTIGAAYNLRESAKARAAEADFQAMLGVRNAGLLRDQFSLRGEQVVADHRANFLNTEMTRGRGEVGFAAGNTVVGEGSALQWDIALEENEALVDEVIDSEFRNARWAYKIERQNLLVGASSLTRASQNIERAANTAFYTSMVSSLGRYASTNYQPQRSNTTTTSTRGERQTIGQAERFTGGF
jgi:hypothetical protein